MINNKPNFKIKKIIEEYFKIDLEKFGGNIEVIQRRKDPAKFDIIKSQYLQNFQRIEIQADNKLFIGDDIIVFLHNLIPSEIVECIPPDYLIYYPICTNEEIERIINVRTQEDFLLKLRADAIADHPRFMRVFNKRRQTKENWSLSNYFDKKPFNAYLSYLSPSDSRLCKKVVAGFAFISEPNGICIKNELGDLIIISESLQYFLYYMNLFIFSQYINVGHYNDAVSNEDIFSYFLIAVRIMLCTETLDFDLDPRGSIPERLSEQVSAVVQDQVEFVIGHEYAHLLKGHLSNKIIRQCSLSHMAMIDRKSPQVKYYNYLQKQEFEADWFAIKNARYEVNKKECIVNAAFTFFMCLDLFDVVRTYISPEPDWRSSHPNPLDRLQKLRQKINRRFGYSSEELRCLVVQIDKFKNFLIKDFLPYNIDELETVGSVYLPSTDRKPLIDRIDF
jgi:hypothetical protein